MAPFVSYQQSIALIKELETIVAKIKARDADLAKQIKRAASGVPLNLAEGRKRIGGDRLHLFRVAAGSVAEVAAGLDVAELWGYIDRPIKARQILDHLGALTWGLTHKRNDLPQDRE